MKRPFFTLLIMLIATCAANAVPARQGLWQTLTLTDGKQVTALLCGDEHMHYWQTADGDCYIADGDNFRLADTRQLMSNSLSRRLKANQRRQACNRRKALGDFSNYKGKKRGLVILVEFSKTSFGIGHDRALYQRILNEENYSEGGFQGSVYDYFKAQSYGQFELTFDIVGPIKADNTCAYYGKNDSEGNDQHAGELVAECCNKIDSQVNFNNYDWDGDGYVDQVLIIYAGQGENNGGGSNTIWPHEWELSESDYGKQLRLDNVNIDTYAVVNELSSWGLAGIGTICHEFSHCLGLPDMYDIYNTGNYGMGAWSVMGSGNYNGNGFTPAAYTSFERYSCGWLKPTELTLLSEVEDMKPLTDSPEAYLIRNDNYPNEYYLLENRQKKGWDAELPGRGMLVLHVDYDHDIWANNVVNTNISSYYAQAYDLPLNDHQRCTLLRAGNRYDKSSVASDAYPYNTNAAFHNTSTPAAKLFHPNTDGSLLLNKGVSKIVQNDDGTMNFRFYPTPTDPGTIVGIEDISASDALRNDHRRRIVILDGQLTIDGLYDLTGRRIE